MRVLIVSQYFYPEEFKINDLVNGLVRRGHSVTVVTGKPNYPQGDYVAGYRFWGVVREDYNGASLIRVPLIRRGKGGAFRLILNYLSFVFFGNWYVRTHKCDYDSVFVWETSPITQVYPGIIACKKSKCRLSMWVQDLWPESVSATTSIHNGLIMSILDKMVARIYAKCDTIFVQSKAFIDSICSKGDFADKIVYAPNWAEDLFLDPKVTVSKYTGLIPDGFKVMFAGNIGEAQDFDSVIQAAKLTSQFPYIQWVIVGDGRARTRIEELVVKEGLSATVHFLGRFPASEMPNFFCHADVMLVSLKDVFIFSLTIPSKVQAYMASGKPILTMLNGEGNRIIEEASCGITSNASDARQLAENVIRMYNMSENERRLIGERGKEYYHKHFEQDTVIDTIESKLILIP